MIIFEVIDNDSISPNKLILSNATISLVPTILINTNPIVLYAISLPVNVILIVYVFAV